VCGLETEIKLRRGGGEEIGSSLQELGGGWNHSIEMGKSYVPLVAAQMPALHTYPRCVHGSRPSR
jgi:hypothetical protein